MTMDRTVHPRLLRVLLVALWVTCGSTEHSMAEQPNAEKQRACHCEYYAEYEYSTNALLWRLVRCL